jgi:hypothetical protein
VISPSTRFPSYSIVPKVSCILETDKCLRPQEHGFGQLARLAPEHVDASTLPHSFSGLLNLSTVLQPPADSAQRVDREPRAPGISRSARYGWARSSLSATARLSGSAKRARRVFERLLALLAPPHLKGFQNRMSTAYRLVPARLQRVAANTTPAEYREYTRSRTMKVGRSAERSFRSPPAPQPSDSPHTGCLLFLRGCALKLIQNTRYSSPSSRCGLGGREQPELRVCAWLINDALE